MVPRRFIAVYYWLTPLFWIVDVVFGANLRAAALEGSPFWTALYYLFCFGCGVAIWKRPGWTAIVGLSEASLNILLLVLGILLPYFRLIDALATGAPTVDTSSLSAEGVVALALSGLVWVTSFHLHVAAVESTTLTRASS